jgi:L-alanine-DL-glutamate epimerase-like enolase superfamily enzyme
VMLRVDATRLCPQSLTVDEAARRGQDLDAEGLIWIEGPTRAKDHVGHARIGSAIRFL